MRRAAMPWSVRAACGGDGVCPGASGRRRPVTGQTQQISAQLAPQTATAGQLPLASSAAVSTESMRGRRSTPLWTRRFPPGHQNQETASPRPSLILCAPTMARWSFPAGRAIEGEVAEAEEGKTVAALRGKGTLSLRFRNVVLPNGQTLPLTATLVSVHDTRGKNTEKSGPRRPDAIQQQARTLPGAGIGTGTGLVFGGPLKGLAIGALAGGGYVLSTKGKDVNLPAQTGMVIRLDQPISCVWNICSTAEIRDCELNETQKQNAGASATAFVIYCAGKLRYAALRALRRRKRAASLRFLRCRNNFFWRTTSSSENMVRRQPFKPQ